MTHFYGYKPDHRDIRDFYYEAPEMGLLPSQIDLRPFCPPVYDQGQLGSCTANAVAGHLDFNRYKQKEPFINPSRLFIYFQERSDDGTVPVDAGSSIRESIKAVVKYGAPPEAEWPYVIQKFTWKPSKQAYADAVKYEALKYLRLKQNEPDLKSCLAQGYPLVCGISVYDSFEAATDGNIPMPSRSESFLGGHAILIVGYENDKWIFRNSWGEGWGASGYGYLPKEYLLHPDLSNDRWTLRQVK